MIGGVAGGTIGHEVAKPEDRVVATIIGAAVGALVGAKIGKELDERDQGCIGQSLELAQPGQSVQWRNDQSGVAFVLTPTGSEQTRRPKLPRVQVAFGCQWQGADRNAPRLPGRTGSVGNSLTGLLRAWVSSRPDSVSRCR